jgi:cytochrome c oxidase subunit II
MNWLLDPSVSTFGPDIDRLYYIILIITGIVFVLTEFLLIYFLVKYRKREGQRAEYIHGSTRAEVIWTAVPFVIVLVLALMSKPVWDQIKDPALFPEGAYEIELTSRQFEWEARYAGSNGAFDGDDSFSVLNRIHVPVNRPVILHLESEDVIHSLFVPAFRVKQDAVPGRRIPVWFEVTETGEYELGCAELCGLGHYRMDGLVVVQTEAEFEAWKAERATAALGGATPTQVGAAERAPDPASTDDGGFEN